MNIFVILEKQSNISKIRDKFKNKAVWFKWEKIQQCKLGIIDAKT